MYNWTLQKDRSKPLRLYKMGIYTFNKGQSDNQTFISEANQHGQSYYIQVLLQLKNTRPLNTDSRTKKPLSVRWQLRPDHFMMDTHNWQIRHYIGCIQHATDRQTDRQVNYCRCYNHTNARLTLTLLMWNIWWAPNNVSKWQMGFNSAFKGLIREAKSWPLKTCGKANQSGRTTR
jgi:hypothetical protein